MALVATVIGGSLGMSNWLPSLVLLAAGFVILFFVRTWHCLLGILLVRPILDARPLQEFHVLPGDLSLGALVALGLIAVGLPYMIVKPIRFHKQPVAVAFLVFIVLSSVSFPFATFDWTPGIVDLLRVLSSWVLFVLLMAELRRREQVVALTAILFAASVIPLVVGWYQMFTETGTHVGGMHRINGTLVWPNAYARFLAMPMILAAVYSVYARTWRHRLPLLAYLLVAGGAEIATFTRASWLSVLAALSVVGFLRKRRSLVVLLILIPALTFAFPSISDRFDDLSTSRNTFLQRQSMWDVALGDYLSQPLPGLIVGAGWGHLQQLGETSIELPVIRIHNDYVRLLSETGALGLFAYLALFATLFRQSLLSLARSADAQLEPFALAFLGILVARVIIGASDGSVLSTPVTEFYFWSCAAIALAIPKLGPAQRAPARSG